MSSECLAWAIRAKIGRSAVKNLLMIVADLANHDTGEVYASLAYLQEHTGLSKKTVIAGLQELESPEFGVLSRTGGMRGLSGQIPVYHFTMSDRVALIPRRGGKLHQFAERPDDRGKNATGAGVKTPPPPVEKRHTEPSNRNQEIGTGLYTDDDLPSDVERDLLGDPIVTAEQIEAERKAETIHAVQEGWNRLTAHVPGIAKLRGGKLDDTRAEKAYQLATKFAGDDETPKDVWAGLFREILSSRFLCGEVLPREGRAPFHLQLTWLLENANFTKVAEGKYADGRNPDQAGGGTARPGHSPGGSVVTRVLDRRRAGRKHGAAGRNSGLPG